MSHRRIARNAAHGLLIPALVLLAACGSDPTTPTGPPTITTTSLPDAVVGEAYSEAVHVTGGAGGYFWSIVDGELPPGLALSVDDQAPEDALITGIPQTAGTFTFDIRVAASDERADTARLAITVTQPPGPVAITTPRLPPALAGAIYRVILDADGGDHASYQWTVVEGTLPAGLSLDSSGQFQGEPQRADTTTFTVEVSSGGFTNRRSFTLAVVPHDQTRFNITVFPVVDIPAAFRPFVREAVRRWEAALTGNLAPIAIPADTLGFTPEDCAGFGTLVNGTAVDDIMLLVNIDSIDGAGDGQNNILGQAGPCALRVSNGLPAVGILTLDEYDLGTFNTAEAVIDIIQHEIGHVLGFGALWDHGDFDLLTGAGGNDPRYVGEAAVAEYRAAGGTASSIPVENEGGEGTRDSHWRTSVFGDELMTGFFHGGDSFLSRMSIASFADLGYQVDLSAADEGTLLGWMADEALAARILGDDHVGHDIVGVGPILVFDDETHTIVPEP